MEVTILDYGAGSLGSLLMGAWGLRFQLWGSFEGSFNACKIRVSIRVTIRGIFRVWWLVTLPVWGFEFPGRYPESSRRGLKL